jgi:hypothetical protein
VKPRDIDLMQHADGELPLEGTTLDADARAKLGALRDLGEAVRGHLELRADEAAPRLARMWEEIDKQLSFPAERVKAPARPGLWKRFATWLDDHRAHVLTGLVSAGAVAAIMLWLRPGGETVFMPENNGGSTPASFKRQAPQVESLDTPEGTPSVFTIEGEGDEGGSTVIMVTPDDVEGT